MAETIDVEAKKNINLAIDVDKHRRRLLKTDGKVSVQFVGPVITTFEKYRFYLLKNSTSKILEEKYKLRPDYLSYDEYGTVTLWPLILFINGVASIEEFDLDDVLVPSYSSILQISRFNELNIDPVDLDAQAQEPSRQEKIVLYTNKISPNLQDQSSTVNDLTQTPEDPVFYTRRRITLREVDILNQSVDLALVPIVESITLKILNENFSPLYNVHYSVIAKPDGQLKRLSWSDSDNTEGPGLVDVLTTGSVIEIQYAKDENA